MLSKELAREILPLVNDPEFFRLMKAYTNYRIELLRKDLETGSDLEAIKKTQGAIAELRRFENLQDEARTDSK